MESALLGIVVDSSVLIRAERRHHSIPELIEAIQACAGEVELSISPVTVAELVHGIYRAQTPEQCQRRERYIHAFLELLPVHPATARTGFIAGKIEGQEAAIGNVLPFNDVMIAAAAIEQGYGVLTENIRHFEKIPGLDVRPSRNVIVTRGPLSSLQIWPLSRQRYACHLDPARHKPG